MDRDLICKQDFVDMIDMEIICHESYEEPWYIKRFCHLFNKDTPNEVVLGELYWMKKYCVDCLGWETTEREWYTLEEAAKELGFSG